MKDHIKQIISETHVPYLLLESEKPTLLRITLKAGFGFRIKTQRCSVNIIPAKLTLRRSVFVYGLRTVAWHIKPRSTSEHYCVPQPCGR